MEKNAMSNELKIHIPRHQPELEFAILKYIQEEFQQSAIFQDEPASAIPHKDGGVLDPLWQVVQIIGVIEGALQFAERARRLERVIKLQAAIQQAGKPVYLRIKNYTVNLYQKSADQIMNLLAGNKDDE